MGAGVYYVTVSDANDCETEWHYELVEPDVLGLSADIINPVCFNPEGSISVEAFGGSLPYTYHWSNGSIGNEINSLETGTYSVTVTDSNGCNTVETFDLEGDSFSAEFKQTNSDCQNQTVDYEINVAGNQGPYRLSYTTSTGGVIENLESNLGDNGGIATATNISIGHTYTIVISDNNGCSIEEILDIPSVINSSVSAPHLCIVTTNEAGHNEILWEDGEGMASILEHNIYREEGASGNFEKIGSIEDSLDNSYIDTSAVQTTRAYQYYVTASDACGNESPASAIHKTIHLQIGQGVGGNLNLQWDEYQGITYDNVVVLRGSSPTDLEEYVTLPANVFTFTDDNPPAGNVFYQLVIGVSVDCTINKSLFQLKSNIAEMIETSTEEIEWVQSIYPNPVSGLLNLELKESAQLVIVNIDGKAIQQHNLKTGSNQINTVGLSAGMYLLQLTQGEEVFVTRLVKE